MNGGDGGGTRCLVNLYLSEWVNPSFGFHATFCDEDDEDDEDVFK